MGVCHPLAHCYDYHGGGDRYTVEENPAVNKVTRSIGE